MFRTGKAKSGSKKAMSRSERAGVVFPVSRLSRHLKKTTPHHRLGSAAPVYLAAILEYLSGKNFLIINIYIFRDASQIRIYSPAMPQPYTDSQSYLSSTGWFRQLYHYKVYKMDQPDNYFHRWISEIGIIDSTQHCRADNPDPPNPARLNWLITS